MVSTATPAARANCSIRYSMSRYSHNSAVRGLRSRNRVTFYGFCYAGLLTVPVKAALATNPVPRGAPPTVPPPRRVFRAGGGLFLLTQATIGSYPVVFQ